MKFPFVSTLPEGVRITLISVSNYSGFQLTWNIQLGKDCTQKQTTPRPIEYLWYRVLLLSLPLCSK